MRWNRDTLKGCLILFLLLYAVAYDRLTWTGEATRPMTDFSTLFSKLNPALRLTVQTRLMAVIPCAAK